MPPRMKKPVIHAEELRRIVLVLCALLVLTGVFYFSRELGQSRELPSPMIAPTEPGGEPDAPAASQELTIIPEATPRQIPTTPAQPLKLRFDSWDQASRVVQDGSYETDYSFSPNSEITVSAQEPIGALYILFGTYPGQWQLFDGSNIYQFGNNGFLHEYVELEEPSETVTLRLQAKTTRIRELYAFTEGTVPDEVQNWQAPDETADILIFVTHADDELLYMGGMIPYYAAVRGLKVQLVYMTTNYLDGDYPLYHNSERLRPHEALNGLWRAGDRIYPITNMVQDYYCNSLADAQNYYGLDRFFEFQVKMIRRFKPLVVVTQDERGEYGHGAHILTALSVERAVEAAADASVFPDSAEEYGVWDTPKTYLHKYGSADDMTILNYEEPSDALGGLTPFETAQEAYSLHFSQHQYRELYVYSFGHPSDSHRYGLYRSLVGADEEKNDLMEHVSRELFPANES